MVVRFGAMGDTVILLTLINMLYQRFGTPVDLVSSGSWVRPLLEAQPGVGRIHLLRSGRTPYSLDLQKRRLAAALREHGPTLTWACQYAPKARELLRRACIPDTLIVDLNCTEPFGHPHIVDRYACFAQCAPVAFDEFYAARFHVNHVEPLRYPPLLVPAMHRTATQLWLQQLGLAHRPLILVQAGNKRTMRRWLPRQRCTNAKYWPERHWATVIRALREQEPDAEILLLGVAAESRMNHDIQRLAAVPGVRSIAGQLPIPRLLALQERALGMVSVDTGPAHSAAALDCPLVVLFGAVDPGFYAPRGPSQAVEVVTSNGSQSPSMQDITPDQVIAAWRRLTAARRHLAQPPAERELLRAAS